MSIFRDPETHAANPPETWMAVKRGERCWALVTSDGGILDNFTSRRDALAAREDGFLRRLYDQETLWYAGENIPGWRPYAELRG